MKVLKKIYKSKAVKAFRHLVLFFVSLLVLFLVIIIPYAISIRLGALLGLLVSKTALSYRRTVDDNLKKSFPEKSLKEIEKIRDDTFRNIGMNTVEFALLGFRPKSFWMKKIDCSNMEQLKGLYEAGRGMILFTAHVGNWEMLGSFLSWSGFPISVVARKISDKRMDSLLVWLRKRSRVKTIYRDGKSNVKKMISAIRKGEALGILIDQDTKVGGAFVDFFGRPAYTPTAVSQFARIKNAAVVPIFISREKDLRHKVHIYQEMAGGEDFLKETQSYTRIIEEMISKYPSQWVWMHKRWKRTKA